MTSEPQESSLESLALRRLRQLTQPLDQPGTIIRFPSVFHRLCSLLCITKREAWTVLRRLESSGKLEIVRYQGVRLPPVSTKVTERVEPTSWRPTTTAQRRILRHLRTTGKAYPSDLARSLNIDIDTVFSVARRLQREGLIDA
jgi:Mn-dependent DtxR family transcriptional regulator